MSRRAIPALLLVLSACTGAPAAPPQQPAPEVVDYAALGDSYTAAPYVVSTDVANGCLRSEHNYPALLAEEIGAQLTDVSCGGARTRDVFRGQHTQQSAVQPPQIEAVRPGDELVTVGLGGNDGDLFAQLVRRCPITGPQGEQLGQPGRCGHLPPAVTSKLIAGTQRDLVRVLTTVKKRAPEAHVVLVGYPRLLGERPCQVLPIAPRDFAGAGQVAVRLRDAQHDAARAAGVDFVDMHELSRGHDACSGDPWVQGIHSDRQQGAAMHPTPAGAEAMAEAIADHLAKAGF